MSDVIRLRDPRWEKEQGIRRVLRSIQVIERLSDLLQTDELDAIEYFALSMFPIEERCGNDGDGNVSEEYAEFLEGISNYSIDEFYEKVMKGR